MITSEQIQKAHQTRLADVANMLNLIQKVIESAYTEATSLLETNKQLTTDNADLTKDKKKLVAQVEQLTNEHNTRVAQSKQTIANLEAKIVDLSQKHRTADEAYQKLLHTKSKVVEEQDKNRRELEEWENRLINKTNEFNKEKEQFFIDKRKAARRPAIL